MPDFPRKLRGPLSWSFCCFAHALSLSPFVESDKDELTSRIAQDVSPLRRELPARPPAKVV